MPPNARPLINLVEEEQDSLLALLDEKADTQGLANVNGEDWTDVKHSERKKRDRILDDGVLIKFMVKSDYEGFKRLAINLSILGLTAYTLSRLELLSKPSWEKTLWALPLYIFYGFQFQCFAFAGQHEFLHRNAFKTKWYNDLCLFLTGCATFELGEHERVMHKQHHTFTNHIDKDPELTSFYSREELENPGFRNVPIGRWGYLRMFWDVFGTFKCRAGRILHSACGIAVDYSGVRWSLKDFNYSKESGIMKKLQQTALAQLTFYTFMFVVFGRSLQGLSQLLFWWILPNFAGYPAVNYFRNLEHADCEISTINNTLRNTRSVRSNLLIRLLLWDTNYHAEHHCYPMVPFFNLHKINELMYDHVIHNEADHFTTQNWKAFQRGGWLDQQSEQMKIHAKTE